MAYRSLSGELAAFAAELSFSLDPFQQQSCEALQGGHSVLVCAPTGAGKTVVGEFAVHLALAAGGKCFYTTPIKALSNQKYADLVERYGRGAVGLLTGDQSLNPEASVVVMTTEVLRNMLYAGSDALQGLSYVVMDEVHYLADRFRGAVWEEVILHLPPDVRLVSLSATVSNAEEFGAWMETVRGDTAVVVDETRPVPLWQHVLVGRRMFDLFDANSNDQKILVDEELVRYIKHRESADRMNGWGGPRGRGGPRRDHRGIPRPEMLALLDKEGLLPAITFIFSRAGCDGALAQCARSRLDLSRPEDYDEIERIITKHTGDLPRADLEVLGYWEWRDALHRGLAAHHAGMLPAFRHAVEELFVHGLVRAVFATETLALGINMPARTVVLERLVKFNGEAHAELTPGEYTQLTGRAGRRGIDIEGHAVVVWTPDVDTSAVAGLASTRTYPLRSSFRPGYNMSINLIDRMGSEESRALLERSFAQFQADRSVVGLVRGIERNEGALRKLRAQIGDESFLEYLSLRERIKQRERDLERQGRADRRGAAVASLTALRRGDVVAIPSGRRQGLAVILEPDATPGDPRPLVLTEDKWAGRVSAADFPTPAQPLGRMRLPRHVDHRTARIRRDLASALRSTDISAPGRQRRGSRANAADDRELLNLRRAMRSHPAHTRPDREQLARLGERYNRLERETESMRQKVAATTNSLARTFDRIVGLLAERGYVDNGEVTADGRRLARIYTEADLVVAECLRQGLWRGLGPAELAAVVSILVYESRQESGGFLGPAGPTAPIRRAVGATVGVWSQLRTDEARHRLPPTREPDLGFITGVHKWARGDSLADSLLASGEQSAPLSAGDFVRWCRQVIDLLDQIHETADDTEIAATAAKAVRAIRRGVVAVDAA
ncbi:DEAD/DEAH box helicase [Nocardia pseudobrasiliensis]|uniref:Probable helicase HelY n=1 Tax=Nocardia pseudobrasiliensis TaxID=45979 RepID=A0A370I8T5_9NOCA|nr:RNA helicase [Nocardia pseudobrasiliensis]RDI67108.1 ATP-dependent RNA helicase HelY [Nocardia pseudobrasiliensis]